MRNSKMTRYRYPAVQSMFDSPMHSWDNLHFVGGWQWFPYDQEGDLLVEQVGRGRKPVGFAYPRDPDDIGRWQSAASQLGCTFALLPSEHHARECDVGLAYPGVVGGLFDLDKLCADYRAYLGAAHVHPLVAERICDHLRGLRDRNLASFLDPEWDYGNPKSPDDLAQVGLLLGYPVPSTVACILGEVS